MNKLFEDIYTNNTWKINNNVKSVSGPGSDESQVKEIIDNIPKLLQLYNINKVFDCPCGDFNWISKIFSKNSNYKYTGADIVSKLIDSNKSLYPEINFIHFDITKDNIDGEYDLIICRDLLVHFSYEDIKKAISNIKKSKCKYILMTTFPNKENRNIKTSQWRPVNFEKEPFNFPKPIYTINENCTEGNMGFTDKSLCLWEVKKLIDSFI